MSDFDKSTKEKMADAIAAHFWSADAGGPAYMEHQQFAFEGGYERGRDSVKQSLLILARAVGHDHNETEVEYGNCDGCEAIRKVKRLGDWPLDINKEKA